MDLQDADHPPAPLVLASPFGGFAECPVIEVRDDRLGRAPLVEGLARMLGQPSPRRSLVVGVFGAPGSGRSSVLHMVRSRLAPTAPVVWLDAWYHARHGLPLWRKLLLALVEGLADEEQGLPVAAQTEYRKAMLRRDVDELAACLYRSQRACGQDGPPPAKGTAGPGLETRRPGTREGRDPDAQADARSQAQFRDDIAALDTFHWRLDALVAAVADETPGGLTLFVDHLDRCELEDARQAFDAVRLLLDVPELRVVIALDAPRGPDRPARWADGLLDLGLCLPPPAAPDVDAYAHEVARSLLVPSGLAAGLAARGAGPNPRRIRQFLTGLALLAHTGHADRLDPLAKLLALRTGFPKEFKVLREAPGRLKELERAARAAAARGTGIEGADQRLGQLLAAPPELVRLDDAELLHLIAVIGHVP